MAFEMALIALRLRDRGDLANEIVAQKIIALAKAGEYGGFAIKVLDEQGNEVAYVPIGKRSS